ncbi:carboxylesterase family protein [Demequina capsici]|uniref:Carboxylic ester hydrolase n=1 Tax=Demequina capsici TaxID=3075620 RepID=A0AA96FCD0_9MICO|nr:carboxylesterase family protein [Demequina sp. PMTSA13]WNM28251.1 carboxylesterase family protein [Demequina sp. PMTSA13]
MDERETPPVVLTPYGAVQGEWRGASAAFRGIPFAAAPVGDLRYAAPAAPAPWDGVRDATAPGPTPQRRPFGPVTTIPEPSFPGDSTLNVNVFTPAPGDDAAQLPVLVWIHGGGFFAGSPSSPWYDGRAFNRDGVVTVSISYRLGFDGFGFIDGAPLNRGMLDMVAALEWVRDSIGAFGGDPDRVTIAGQSAGGGAVLALLSMPSAAGLFHGAISAAGALSSIDVPTARRVSEAMARAAGVDGSLESWRSLSEDAVLDVQLALDVRSVLPTPSGLDGAVQAIFKEGQAVMPLAFGPIIDGSTLLPFADAVAAAGPDGVPAILSTNAHEFTFPSEGPPFGALEEAFVAAGLATEDAAPLLREISLIGQEAINGQLVTEGLFRVPLARQVAARTAAGAGGRTWLIDFRDRSPVTGFANHCHELPYAWDLLDADGVTQVLGDRPSAELARGLHAAWLGLIVEGRCAWAPVADAPAGALVANGDELRYAPDSYAFETAVAHAGRLEP